jgi:hypothetical protein
VAFVAEFCLDCFNKINNTNLKPSDVKISKEKDWCEECQEYKNIIVSVRRANPWRKRLY